MVAGDVLGGQDADTTLSLPQMQIGSPIRPEHAADLGAIGRDDAKMCGLQSTQKPKAP